MISFTCSPRRRQAQLGIAALLLLLLTFWLQGCAQPDAAPTPTATLASTMVATSQATVASSVTPTKVPTVVATKAGKKPTKTPKPRATVRPATTATPKPRPTIKAMPTRRPKPPNTPTSVTNAAPTGLDVVALAELPPEAQKTVKLIEQGGPFPYARDGIDFQNREELLPRQARGYYHEYTVITPGSADRGARRIIAGSHGELYYTDDHYASFSWIQP